MSNYVSRPHQTRLKGQSLRSLQPMRSHQTAVAPNSRRSSSPKISVNVRFFVVVGFLFWAADEVDWMDPYFPGHFHHQNHSIMNLNGQKTLPTYAFVHGAFDPPYLRRSSPKELPKKSQTTENFSFKRTYFYFDCKSQIVRIRISIDN